MCYNQSRRFSHFRSLTQIAALNAFITMFVICHATYKCPILVVKTGTCFVILPS